MTRSLTIPEIADLKCELRGPEDNLIGRACAQVVIREMRLKGADTDPPGYVLRVAERTAQLAMNVQEVIQTPGAEWEIREPTPEDMDNGVYDAREALAVTYSEVHHG